MRVNHPRAYVAHYFSPPRGSVASMGNMNKDSDVRVIVIETILAVPGGWFSNGRYVGRSPSKYNTIVGAHAPRRSVHTLRYL
jgi:hypothetical protein